MIWCELCDCSFGSQKALDQHLRNSPVHALSHECELWSFIWQPGALDQHLRYLRVHFQLPKTPLNIFFQSFDGFTFDPNLPLSHLYKDSMVCAEVMKTPPELGIHNYQEVLTQEFKLWFGAEDNIAAWHSLCHAVRIELLPRTCFECEKVVYYASCFYEATSHWHEFIGRARDIHKYCWPDWLGLQ